MSVLSNAVTDKLNIAGGGFIHQVGTGDFTYELWVYATAKNSQQSWSYWGDTSGPVVYLTMKQSAATGTFICEYAGGTNLDSGYSYAVDTWYRFVVSRGGTTLRIRIFADDLAMTKLAEQTATYSGDLDTATKLTVMDGQDYDNSPVNGMAAALHITVGTELTDAQCRASARAEEIPHLMVGSYRRSWWLRSTANDTTGVQESSGFGPNFVNTSVTDGTFAPRNLRPLGMRVLGTDDFNRSNGAVGSPWSTFGSLSGLNVSGNQVLGGTASVDNANIYGGTGATSHQWAEVQLLSTGTQAARDIALCVRVQSGGLFYWRPYDWDVYYNGSAAIAGATSLGNRTPATVRDGMILRLEVRQVGGLAELRCFADGVQVGSAITTSNGPQSGGEPGLAMYGNSGNACDEFACGDFGRTTSLEYYVDPASSGGNGTTPATSGANAAFASLATALSTLKQDLTDITPTLNDEDGAATVALRINCAGATADASAATLDAVEWRTSRTRRIEIRGESPGAYVSTGHYRISLDRNSYLRGVLEVLGGLHVDLVKLQAENTQNTASLPVALSIGAFGSLYPDNCEVRVYGGFYWTSSARTDHRPIHVHNLQGHRVRLKMRNVVAVAGQDGQVVTVDNYFDPNEGGDADLWLYNNTLVVRSGTTGYCIAGGGASNGRRAYNNLCQAPGSTNWSFGDGTPPTGGNLTKDASSPQTGLRNKTITFLDATNYDYRLAAGDTDAIDDGTDLSADSYWPFAVDAGGQSRSGSWDIGADELDVPTTQQEGSRFRNDDGSESGATWKAAQDTDVSGAAGAFRLRMLLNTTGDQPLKAIGLKYSVNGGQKRSVN